MVLAAKQCDSCKSATATVFCRADSAYLCIPCDSDIHAANKLASRHARVWVCEVCEQSPASVTCKADAAHLCTSCDRDIHSANPLASRHDRLPLLPFFDDKQQDSYSTIVDRHSNTAADAAADVAAATSAAISKLFGEEYYSDSEEAEAATWLLANPKTSDEEHKSIDFLFANEGLGFAVDPKPDPSVDGVVPDPDRKEDHTHIHQHSMYSLSSYNHNFDINLKHHYPLTSFAPTQPSSLSHSISPTTQQQCG